MKRIALLLLYLLFFTYTALLLLPKANIYYALEEEILKKEIIFSNEKIKEHLFSLDIHNIEMYYKKQYVLNIDKLELSNNLFIPFLFEINAQGDFGTLKAKPDLIKRKVTVYLKASKIMKSKHQEVLKNMKQIKGIYIYEFEF